MHSDKVSLIKDEHYVCPFTGKHTDSLGSGPDWGLSITGRLIYIGPTCD
jgi:hypothetical protein